MLLKNNDINITGCCIEVETSDPENFKISVDPELWKFLYDCDHRTIYPVKDIEKLGAKSAVRITFKAFEMDIPFNLRGIELSNERLACSHKVKIDKMKDWIKSPFADFEVEKRNTYYLLKKKSKKVNCIECIKGRANKNCLYKRCKKCCNRHTANNNASLPRTGLGT